MSVYVCVCVCGGGYESVLLIRKIRDVITIVTILYYSQDDKYKFFVIICIGGKKVDL